MSSAMTTPGRARYAADVVLHLVVREFKLRYQRSLFGWLWSIANPLARLAVLGFVFTRVVDLGVPSYPTFLFAGLIAYSWFSAGVSSATSSALVRRDLLFRPGFPRPAIPVISILTDSLDLLAALPVLGVFILLADGIPATALLFPLVLIVQFALMLGLGYIFCAANVYFRDVGLLVDVALLLGFYLSPVFYGLEAVPARYRDLLELNPMTHIVDAYRSLLVYGQLPELVPAGLTALASFALLGLGYLVFRATSGVFVDEL